MFRLADPKDIGMFVSELIDEKYDSYRQFCKAWLEYEGVTVNNDNLNKKANKFSQIRKGQKGIQTYDLPAFCTLLGTSCEEILSAGYAFQPERQRLTNYAVALSHDEKLWEEYIHDAEKPVLNADERSNTVLDYAVRFKNLDLIKYLINKKYIWFDNGDYNKYAFSGFGAGTSIERRSLNYDYDLQPQLKSFAFREKIVALAIEKNDLNLLKEMRAREIPDYYCNEFYQYGYRLIGNPYRSMGNAERNEDQTDYYYNQKLMDNLVGKDYEILDYFTDSFNIQDRTTRYKDGETRTYELTYFFISDLLEMLIESKNGFAETALRKAIKYNKKTCEEVKRQLKENIEISLQGISQISKDNELYEALKKDRLEMCFSSFKFSYDENTNIIRVYCDDHDRKGYKNVVRNMIRVDAESSDSLLKLLIEELNETFDKILNIKNEFI